MKASLALVSLLAAVPATSAATCDLSFYYKDLKYSWTQWDRRISRSFQYSSPIQSWELVYSKPGGGSTVEPAHTFKWAYLHVTEQSGATQEVKLVANSGSAAKTTEFEFQPNCNFNGPLDGSQPAGDWKAHRENRWDTAMTQVTVQKTNDFATRQQQMKDVARTNFNQQKQDIQMTRDQIRDQKMQEAKQSSCDAFAGRVNAMGHLSADRKEKVIANFFSRMGCMVAAPVFHCTEGPNGACYESDGPHVGNYRFYSQDYQGWKSFCSSWRSNRGSFNGGVGRC